MQTTVELSSTIRPWAKWGFERALKGIRTAGFSAVTLPVHGVELLITPDTSLDDATRVVDTIHQHDLELSCLSHAAALDLSDEEALAAAKRQIDHCRRLGTSILIDMGHNQPANYDRYFRLMQQAAPYAADQGITIAIKPHGGLSTTAADTLAAIRRVDHPSFRICYDPGNLFHYAAETPVMALPKIGHAVVAVGIRDHTGVGASKPPAMGSGMAGGMGGGHGMGEGRASAGTQSSLVRGHAMGDAMASPGMAGMASGGTMTAVRPAAPMGGGMAAPVTPGDGIIDFRALFSRLREQGFSGPCALESVTPRETAEETDAEAARAYRFITDLVAVK